MGSDDIVVISHYTMQDIATGLYLPEVYKLGQAKSMHLYSDILANKIFAVLYLKIRTKGE